MPASLVLSSRRMRPCRQPERGTKESGCPAGDKSPRPAAPRRAPIGRARETGDKIFRGPAV